ncbi:transposase [Blastococcus sp. URHD0036]|uniref:transposase n=1 Tax=Blastococcus sp. URHD0036 TaxID=1380356 RepID=UPI0006916DF2|nr:transposase [Blastococcus sp. URHD0036]
MLSRIEAIETALAEPSTVIATAFEPWAHQPELPQTIPGVGEKVAQVIIAETGADMSRFPTPEHLASWAGVAPGTRESAGKRYPVRPPHGNKWLTAMLVEAAGSVGRMRGANCLAAQHARLTSRRGMARAQLAVGHSILVSAYWMLTRDEPYQDLAPEWLARRNGRPTPAAWSPSSSASVTPWSSTRPPEALLQNYCGLASPAPALTRACSTGPPGSTPTLGPRPRDCRGGRRRSLTFPQGRRSQDSDLLIPELVLGRTLRLSRGFDHEDCQSAPPSSPLSNEQSGAQGLSPRSVRTRTLHRTCCPRPQRWSDVGDQQAAIAVDPSSQPLSARS